MEPILNHLDYLKEQGSTEMGEHQSREDTKLIFMSCGCTVIAETSDNPLASVRHYTVPCDKHSSLRDHNYSFQAIAEINKRNIRASFLAAVKAPADLTNH